MHYDIFRNITRFQTVLLHSKHSRYELHILRYISKYYTVTNGSAAFGTLQGPIHILQYIIFVTQTNHVCDFITLNYTSMTRCVGIY